jgi:hypothetical protein
MTPPPKLCPPPAQRDPLSCPLYTRRLLEAQREARLSAAIRQEQPGASSLVDLISLEAAQRQGRPPALPPGPLPTRPISILDQLKEDV